MNIRVFLHVRLLMESLTAVHAGKWSCIAMYQQMCCQCRRTLECFPALCACKYTFLCMNNSVLIQAHFKTECFTANIAREWACTRVCTPNVNFQTMCSRKYFVTVCACVVSHRKVKDVILYLDRINITGYCECFPYIHGIEVCVLIPG